MSVFIRRVTIVLLIVLAAPYLAMAQQVNEADAWRTFAQQVGAGADLDVSLRNGQSFRATAVAAREDAFVLQPRTRVPVAVAAIPYEEIQSITKRDGRGVGAGKAAAIGVGVGAGAFFGLMFVVIALIAD